MITMSTMLKMLSMAVICGIYGVVGYIVRGLFDGSDYAIGTIFGVAVIISGVNALGTWVIINAVIGN